MVIGSDLTALELRELERRWITRIYAEAAGLRHVDHFTAKELLGSTRTSGDLTALAIPYYLPESNIPSRGAYVARIRISTNEQASRRGSTSRLAATAITSTFPWAQGCRMRGHTTNRGHH